MFKQCEHSPNSKSFGTFPINLLLNRRSIMPLLLLALCLCSCSPKQTDAVRYSDMAAAADAGRTPASSNARPESGGVK